MLKDRLLQVTKQYSVNLVLIVKKMVEFDQKKRLTFHELANFLKDYKTQILTFTSFSIGRL